MTTMTILADFITYNQYSGDGPQTWGKLFSSWSRGGKSEDIFNMIINNFWGATENSYNIRGTKPVKIVFQMLDFLWLSFLILHTYIHSTYEFISGSNVLYMLYDRIRINKYNIFWSTFRIVRMNEKIPPQPEQVQSFAPSNEVFL